MAFTRKALKDLGVDEAKIDDIMTLHGTSMGNYVPRSEIDELVKQATGGVDIATLTEKAGRADTLEQELATTHRNYAVNDYLKSKGVVGVGALKAAKSLFDLEKVEAKDGALTGMDEQYEEIVKDASVASIFSAAGAPPANQNPGAGAENKPQFGTPPAAGMTPPAGGETVGDEISKLIFGR